MAEPVNKILDRPHTDKIYAEPNPVDIKYFFYNKLICIFVFYY